MKRIAVSSEQSANADCPSMVVTLLGIVMLVRLLQPSNASSPMVVTLLGRVMLVRLTQLLKAWCKMLVTLLGRA